MLGFVGSWKGGGGGGGLDVGRSVMMSFFSLCVDVNEVMVRVLNNP